MFTESGKKNPKKGREKCIREMRRIRERREKKWVGQNLPSTPESESEVNSGEIKTNVTVLCSVS